MAFELENYWVWDFWLAEDGEQFHMFYLHAPRSLGDPNLRHRNARIGRATSPDLVNWVDHGQIFDVGAPGSFDETATWTGSVVRGNSGLWNMFYTGARFLSPDSNENIQTIGMAVSEDLCTWFKRPGPICTARGEWYEKLGTTKWPEEAWRDPWVFHDEKFGNWHMLITARANCGDELDRGVIGHAVSKNLNNWEVKPPRSAPGVGFAHLEVPQILTSGDNTNLIFCCDSPKLAGQRTGEAGGIWHVDITDSPNIFPIENAKRLTNDTLYAGRIISNREGQLFLLAFEGDDASGNFVGRIADPIPIDLGAKETLVAANNSEAAE